MLTQSFNVLDRFQNVHSSYLIEASAGTGKTYSIENIVVRLLIDQAFPCNLDNILVVTFTKAATADLKLRIRKNLCKIYDMLQGISSGTPPDYLAAVLEKGSDSIEYARQQIEQALACFEQAPIFTIHGFCHRMLKEFLFEGNTSASLNDKEEGVSPALLYRLIKDFFRTELSEKLASHAQLQRVLTAFGGVEGLEKELYHLVTRGIAIAAAPTAQELFHEFCRGMEQLKNQVVCSKEQILDDFYVQASLYKGICDIKKVPKRENVDKVERFASLYAKNTWELADFDTLICDGLYLSEIFNTENLASKKQPIASEELHCPDLIAQINLLLAPIIDTARNPDLILCALAHRCKTQVTKYLTKNEIVGFDDLLSNMHHAVQQPQFALKVRQRYATAIIDEFQDTDPIQWEIFRAIFRPEGEELGRLYLVGDPKQSIYGFRQADIYTYLAAGDVLGADCRASLDTNYRSTPALINALNVLFSEATAPGLIALPRLKETLPYQTVESGGQVTEKQFEDERGAIHFFTCVDSIGDKAKKLAQAEENDFLPFIANELQQLRAQGITLNHCSVLVSDRFQAARLMRYLQLRDLPTAAQHSESLTETVAFDAMKELLAAILSPQNESLLKVALGGPLIAWSQQEVLALEDPYALEPLIAKSMYLRKIWCDVGFAALFQSLLDSTWNKAGKSIAEDLLAREGGLELYHCLRQIAEILIERETAEQLTPRKLFETFDELKRLEEEGEAVVKLRNNPEKEGVRILTIHSSKGLEFEIVFALGVIKRSKRPSMFVPIAQSPNPSLLTVASSFQDVHYIQYCQELDAEKIRQLYVAFTRAKQRLYIPLFFDSSGKACELGTASPMELYLAVMGCAENNIETLYARISEISRDKSLECIDKLTQKASITMSSSSEMGKRMNRQDAIEPSSSAVHIKAPPKAIISGRSLFMHSFTSLSMNSTKNAVEVAVDKECPPPCDFEALDKSVHTLPAGSQVGVLLHEILEKIPFELASKGESDAEFRAFIDSFVEKTPFAKWSHVIAEVVYKALTAILPIGDSGFCLSSLLESNCYREHEFLYTTDEAIHPEFEAHSGYLKGVIDLMFEHKGKFYLLDWKSNWLGPDNTCYTEMRVDRAMWENDYFLQAQIYTEALRRYLKLIDPRPFEEIFGGAIYVFLRGLDGCGVRRL